MKYREKAPTKDINNPQTGNTPQNIVGRQNQRCPRRIQFFCGKKSRKYKEMISTWDPKRVIEAAPIMGEELGQRIGLTQ